MLDKIKDFWERNPCGVKDAASFPEGSLGFFEAIDRHRYQGIDFMQRVVKSDCWSGRKILEVGCGLGEHLLQFAKAGATVHGVDLTERGIKLTNQRFSLCGHKGLLCVGDAENLPFGDDYFDFAYAWGILHHTQDPRKAVREMIRVLKPGGHVLSMFYHRCSLVALQMWLYYGIGHGKPWRSPSELIAARLESPGTKVFSRNETKVMFEGLENVEVQTIVTRFDTRIGRRFFLPRWVRRFIPSSLGWYIVVRANKPRK